MLSRNICSQLQSNYNITKSFIIALLKQNVKKFDFPPSNHFNLILGYCMIDWGTLAGQSLPVFVVPKALLRKLLGNLIWVGIHFNYYGVFWFVLFFKGKNRIVFMLSAFDGLRSLISPSSAVLSPPPPPARSDSG